MTSIKDHPPHTGACADEVEAQRLRDELAAKARAEVVEAAVAVAPDIRERAGFAESLSLTPVQGALVGGMLDHNALVEREKADLRRELERLAGEQNARANRAVQLVLREHDYDPDQVDLAAIKVTRLPEGAVKLANVKLRAASK